MRQHIGPSSSAAHKSVVLRCLLWLFIILCLVALCLFPYLLIYVFEHISCFQESDTYFVKSVKLFNASVLNKTISLQDCLSSLKAMEREESLQRLEFLKNQLMELEHQYEKSKPLVQLVDNMVKLGSLYNRPGSTIERLERNQRLRQKVLAEHALEQQRYFFYLLYN